MSKCPHCGKAIEDTVLIDSVMNDLEKLEQKVQNEHDDLHFQYDHVPQKTTKALIRLEDKMLDLDDYLCDINYIKLTIENCEYGKAVKLAGKSTPEVRRIVKRLGV